MKNPIKNFVVIVQIDNKSPKFLFQHFCDLEVSNMFPTNELIENIITLSEFETDEQKIYFEVMSQLYFNSDEVTSKIPSLHSNDLSAILNINVKRKKKTSTYLYDVQFVNSQWKTSMNLSFPYTPGRNLS